MFDKEAVNGWLDRLAEMVAKRLKEMSPVSKRLYSYDEVAAYIGRTPQAVRHLVMKRAFPVHKYDDKPAIDVRDLDAWIDSNKE